jgi:meso-butanediol dehydrogenase / (S,S)-butanediol dehydrogenase / diacetyl reductase
VRRFDGKTVIVTGASSGMGQEISWRFADEGAHVVAVDVNGSGLAETQAKGAAGAIEPLVLDVSDPAAVQKAVGEVSDRLGHINVMVNCAGIAPMTGVLEITPEQWQRVIGTNLSGVFYMSQAAARNMVDNGGGVIVNISSCNSFIVESPYADYNASKAGVNLLTQSMAFELGHRGVRCVAVAPGMTMTPMMDFTHDQETYRGYLERIPMRRPAVPRDQANVVLFLASDDAAYITGITIRVDGGIMQGFWADPRMAPPVPAFEKE